MRNLIQVVSLFFIVIGIVLAVAVIPPLIERAEAMGNFSAAIGVWVAALTPGGGVIIFGSLAYMLCSIDMRLEELVNKPQPKLVVQQAADGTVEPAEPPVRDHDLF